MSRLQKLPYLLPAPEHVNLGEWLLTINGITQSAGELLPEWDAAVPICASITAEVDVKEILTECHLSSNAALRLAAVWRSPGTGLRGCGSTIDLKEESLNHSYALNLEVDGTMLAGSIVLGVVMTLIEAGSTNDLLAPKLPGSLLWHKEKSVLLEGQAARFPMELVDFAKGSWLPENAAWYLDWDTRDFDQIVLGTLRLYINAGHEKVRRAASEQDEASSAIRESIRFDVARTMIAAALTNEGFILDPSAYSEGTVGAAVSRLLTTLFPNETLEALRNTSQQYPHLFECQLQHNLRLFWE